MAEFLHTYTKFDEVESEWGEVIINLNELDKVTTNIISAYKTDDGLTCIDLKNGHSHTMDVKFNLFLKYLKGKDHTFTLIE